MLKAILHGKAGRIDQGEQDSVSWGSLFKTREDLMTAAIFSRFSYLSANLQSRLLKYWLGIPEKDEPYDFLLFEGIEFWPRYKLNNGDKCCEVEPDLVLRFKHFNVMIEIKPPAGGSQYFEQWQKEITSYLQSDDRKDLPLYFLAIGRINERKTQTWIDKLKEDNDTKLEGIIALKWQTITDSIIKLRYSNDVVFTPQDHYILDDIVDALKLYGLKTVNFDWQSLKDNYSFKALNFDTIKLWSRNKQCKLK
ncbi:MAG: hypothetical protein HRU40_19880 [Saprospiraceae bacterium]|nr:hypothetical protein [Saprospiraceae bacterium]